MSRGHTHGSAIAITHLKVATSLATTRMTVLPGTATVPAGARTTVWKAALRISTLLDRIRLVSDDLHTITSPNSERAVSLGTSIGIGGGTINSTSSSTGNIIGIGVGISAGIDSIDSIDVDIDIGTGCRA
jgi:hypothetical protein